MPVRIAGTVLAAAGAGMLISAFAQFVIDGRGIPAPPAPTERLVVSGLYRYVRNPRYLAVLAVIAGQALVLSRPVLLACTAVMGAAVGGFARWYEQPTLARRYGGQYETYRRDVPGWRPPAATRPKETAAMTTTRHIGTSDRPGRILQTTFTMML